MMKDATSSDAHRTSWLNLPWYLNNTLDSEERAEVEAHVAQCPSCQEELRLLAAVRHEVRESDSVERPAEENVSRLRRKVEARLPGGKRKSLPWTNRFPDWLSSLGAGLQLVPVGMRAAIIGQFALILILGVLLVRVPGETTEVPGTYETLSSGSSALPVPHLRIRFAKDTPEHRLRAVLTRAKLNIVAGPTRTGIYTATCVPKDLESCDLDAAADALTQALEIEAAFLVEE